MVANIVDDHAVAVEIRAASQWARDYETTSRLQRAAVRARLASWFAAVARGEIVERRHELAGDVVGTELFLGGRRVFATGLPTLIAAATASTDTTFAAHAGLPVDEPRGLVPRPGQGIALENLD